jgi:ABC-2 type transport system permease protein
VGLLRTVVSVSVIGMVGAGFYAVWPDSAGWVVIPAAAILLVFGWAVTLGVMAMTIQYGDSAEVFSWGTLVLLMPLSGFFYPVESLPGVLEALARAIPLTYVFEAVRQGLATGAVAWRELGVAAAGTVVLLGLTARLLARQLSRFRREGWVTRFT